MNHRIIHGAIETLTAIGTLAVAILAIWGDYFRAWLAGPQLELSLSDPQGHLIPIGNGRQAYYFHLTVRNKRTWVPAEAVRILVDGISKRGPDATYHVEPLAYPIQLN